MAGAFSDVVQQEGEANQRFILNFLEQRGETAVLDGFEAVDRDQRMFVDGIAVIEVANDEVFNLVPLGQ